LQILSLMLGCFHQGFVLTRHQNELDYAQKEWSYPWALGALYPDILELEPKGNKRSDVSLCKNIEFIDGQVIMGFVICN
jgi:hypothetical protein